MSNIYDIIIIGSGPAGYCCGLYSARADRKVLLFEGSQDDGLYPGGQLTITSDIENYLGFPEGINGFELTEKFKNQAEKFGVKSISDTVVKVNLSSQPFQVFTKTNVYYCKALVLATGATAKRLGLEKEEKYWHKGISACATCDGALPMFRNKPIFVVGGGDTAMEEASFLSKYGSKIYLVHRREEFRASKIMLDRVKNNPKIEILVNSVVFDLEGENKLERVGVRNVKTGEEKWIDGNGLFYGIGHTPNTSFLDGQIELDEDGYILTEKGSTKTSRKGVFACGDVQDKIYRQAITAAGSGCMSAIDVEHWLNEIN
jgi:thioredoxin reductase (NADPH)